jgi:glutamine synthetase type III
VFKGHAGPFSFVHVTPDNRHRDAITSPTPKRLAAVDVSGDSVYQVRGAEFVVPPSGGITLRLKAEFQAAISALEKPLAHGNGDAFAHATHMRDAVVPAMSKLRVLGDKLETVVADDLWPLPTYREILFIK